HIALAEGVVSLPHELLVRMRHNPPLSVFRQVERFSRGPRRRARPYRRAEARFAVIFVFFAALAAPDRFAVERFGREPFPDGRLVARPPPARSRTNWISVRAGTPVAPFGQKSPGPLSA